MAYAPTQKPLYVKSSPSMEMSPSSLRVPVLQRHRKTVSTGGGRAWSDAEVNSSSLDLVLQMLSLMQEAYLIETREHKMPYKHIAAQLKKTELACRLHYHQLSFGSKSHRQQSISSINSYERSPARGSMTPPAPQQRPLPSFSPPESPEDAAEYEASRNVHSHKPILPKPVLPSGRAAEGTRHLRLVTEDMDSLYPKQYVDIAKLDRIYEAHRLHFWSTIARTYGCNLSPATLEDAWRRAHGVSGSNFPPTPRGSPQSSQAAPSILTAPFTAIGDYGGRGFTPVNIGECSSSPRPALHSAIPGSSRSSCAISSLLTENKEVRSPAQEKKASEVELTVQSAT